MTVIVAGKFPTPVSHAEDLNNKLDEQSKLIANLKASLDKLPAEAAPAVGQTRMKIPDPPTFSGDDSKMKVDDWINQISLYCSASGVVTDHQKIVAAMTRLRSPAATYMKEYFENNTKGEDLGYWKTFEHQLTVTETELDVTSMQAPKGPDEEVVRGTRAQT